MRPLVSPLRVRHERPRRRPTEQRYELAASWIEHGLLPGTRCASLPQAQDALEAPAGPWGRPAHAFHSLRQLFANAAIAASRGS